MQITVVVRRRGEGGIASHWSKNDNLGGNMKTGKEKRRKFT